MQNAVQGFLPKITNSEKECSYLIMFCRLDRGNVEPNMGRLSGDLQGGCEAEVISFGGLRSQWRSVSIVDCKNIERELILTVNKEYPQSKLLPILEVPFL